MPLKTTAGDHGQQVKGRGATINIEGRFEVWNRESSDDGWFQDPGDEPARVKTVISIEHAKSVISRHNSPDVGFAQSINPYRGCAHGCVYCVSGDTLILMGDARTRAISELRIGDEIYGTRQVGNERQYVKSRVIAHWSTIKPAYRITLEDGTELVASADHRFLSDGGWRFVAKGAGRPSGNSLTLSNNLVGTGAFAQPPIESDDYRRGYLGSLLRGDARDAEALSRARGYLAGYEMAPFPGQPAVRAARPIHELIAWPSSPSREWAAGFLAGLFDTEGPSTDPATNGWNNQCMKMLGLSSTRRVAERLRFFHTVRPAVIRRLDLAGESIESNPMLRVVGIEPLGKAMRLYDITTETEDFIANGVVSHNCFARPTHAYLGLSPGLDFETRLTSKANAAEKLREELAKPGYRCETLTIGVNTDAYQPIERQQKITRSILEVASETNHPVSLITKSALIERDLDLLAPMAKRGLVSVTLSITTLDHGISMKMEPRTSAPARRLEAVRRLTAAGIPVNVNVAPVIPFLTDSELESIMEAAAGAGATSAGYVLIRLPWEVRPIFKEWLEKNFPLKAEHVMSRIRDMRDGRENDPNFGSRMVGKGTLAELLSQRFRKAVSRFGLDRDFRELDCSLFVPPSLNGQKTLF